MGWEILTSPRSERREGRSTIIWPISNHWHSCGLSHPFWVFGIMLDNSLLGVFCFQPSFSGDFLWSCQENPAFFREWKLNSQLRWPLVLPWFQSSWCSPLCLPQFGLFLHSQTVDPNRYHWGYGPEQGDSVGEWDLNKWGDTENIFQKVTIHIFVYLLNLLKFIKAYNIGLGTFSWKLGRGISCVFICCPDTMRKSPQNYFLQLGREFVPLKLSDLSLS